ncbi:MAG: trypsin-like peptidase domain-containing protein, partial [Bacillota bacterium]|nr:trypsin-like peptidase domain-containing protein [Bacillota bacterium]
NYAHETDYSQPQNYAQETAAPSRDAGDKKKKKKSIPFGFAISLVLICAVFSLAAGFGGGIWAAEQIGERVSADINKNIGEYLEENGATVLYRSVATEQSAESGEGSSYTKDSVVTSVANLAADSVVEISTQVLTENIYSFFGMGGRSLTQGAGSGVILSNDGYILTCYHVIEDAESIGVTLRDGSQYEATMVGGDKELDIAVIKVEATDLVPAVLGSSDALEVGSPVVAIGNPLGQLGGTVTGGYISALDRALTIDNTTYNLLQTDAAINGGNSGGGLFNANGELVGLVSAKAASVGVEGLGFAIPIDDIAQDIEDLINYGYITSRVTLGVTMVDIMDQRTALAYRVEDYGVYILNVTSGSNAELAGLQAGDRIVSIDGTAIESGDQVVEFISTYSVGDVMDMVISRDGQEIQVLVTMYGPILDTTPSTPVNSGI